MSPLAHDGLTFTVATTVLLAGLRLAGLIGWSWGWVLAPVWLSAGVVAVLQAAAMVFSALTLAWLSWQERAEDRRRRR